MEGPGKYDDICTMARESSGASGVILIVMNGMRGSGISCQFSERSQNEMVPGILRLVANMIEKERTENEQRTSN